MAGLNKHQIIGRLGKDPELRNLENGSSVCSFTVATSETWKDKQSGEKKERTEWHNIVVWNQLGTVCAKWLKKGYQVYISGTVRTRKWEKEGVNHYITEVFADEMIMLGSKPEGSGNKQSQPSAPNSATHGEIPSGGGNDDLPF